MGSRHQNPPDGERRQEKNFGRGSPSLRLTQNHPTCEGHRGQHGHQITRRRRTAAIPLEGVQQRRNRQATAQQKRPLTGTAAPPKGDHAGKRHQPQGGGEKQTTGRIEGQPADDSGGHRRIRRNEVVEAPVDPKGVAHGHKAHRRRCRRDSQEGQKPENSTPSVAPQRGKRRREDEQAKASLDHRCEKGPRHRNPSAVATPRGRQQDGRHRQRSQQFDPDLGREDCHRIGCRKDQRQTTKPSLGHPESTRPARHQSHRGGAHQREQQQCAGPSRHGKARQQQRTERR